MVFPGSRPALWTMALALTVCLGGPVVSEAQDKPAPASAAGLLGGSIREERDHAKASSKTGPTGQPGRQGRGEGRALDAIE